MTQPRYHAPLEHRPNTDEAGSAEGFTLDRKGMDTFLSATEVEIRWLVPEVLASGCLTQIFAPRGIGKSVLADHWAVNSRSSVSDSRSRQSASHVQQGCTGSARMTWKIISI